MKKTRIFTGLLAMSMSFVNLWAIIDIEEEIYAPAAEMKMLDDAMNKGIKEQRERNARRPMVIEESQSFYDSPMLEFVFKNNEYVLEKTVDDVNNTEMKAKLTNRELTITEIKKIEEVIIEEAVTLGTSSTQKRYFESTTSETLTLPVDADEKSFVSHYENGLFKITVQKK